MKKITDKQVEDLVDDLFKSLPLKMRKKANEIARKKQMQREFKVNPNQIN